MRIVVTGTSGVPEEPERRLSTLVASIAQGDERALADFYDRTNRVVYGIALRVARDQPGAEEITMDVFLRIWRTAATYDPARSSVMSWVAMMARSRALDWLRSRQAGFASRTHPLEDLPALSDPSPDPEQATVQAGRSRTIRKVLNDLPQEQRQAIELAYYSGFSHSEIALRLGQPVGTVKTRIRLGMCHLRDSLRQYAKGEL